MDIHSTKLEFILVPSKNKTFVQKTVTLYVDSLYEKYPNKITCEVAGDWIKVVIEIDRAVTLKDIQADLVLCAVKWIQEKEQKDRYYFYDGWNRGLHEFDTLEEAEQEALKDCAASVTIYKENSKFQKVVNGGNFSYP